MTCHCGNALDPARVEFLKETGREVRCSQCSKEARKVGFMDYAHKTAPSLVFVPADEEAMRLARRGFSRSR